MNIYPRRLILNKPTNVRELGGYMRKDRKVTKYREFLRSNLLSELDKEDIDYLVQYGLKTVIDLRSDSELKESPSSFQDYKGVNYVNIPLLSDVHPRLNEGITLGELYLVMLKEKYNIGEMFNYMAKNHKGTLLFNCTAGKDRTGVTACLILMLAQIDKLDISSDYQVSSTYVKKMLEEQFMDKVKDMGEEKIKEQKERLQHVIESKPEYIELFYDAVIEFGGVESYLLSAGVKEKNIEILKSKII